MWTAVALSWCSAIVPSSTPRPGESAEERAVVECISKDGQNRLHAPLELATPPPGEVCALPLGLRWAHVSALPSGKK